MLTVTFFGVVFSSIIWLVYAYHFVEKTLGGMSFFDAGILNVLIYVIFICIPLLLLFAILAMVSSFCYKRRVSSQMFKLFSQMKKNQDYSDLLARIMLETEQNIKDSFALDRIDLIISDINELLSEILIREGLVSKEQVEYLWSKVKNGGKWSFGKVIIENYNSQSSFQKRLYTSACEDNILAGTIMEFCARYQTLIGLLEKHDKDHVFQNIIETGVFGKVFAIFAPVSDEIRRSRDAFAVFNQSSSNISKQDSKVVSKPAEIKAKPAEVAPVYTNPEPKAEASYHIKDSDSASNSKAKNFINRVFKHTPETPKEETKDAFSLALERSFNPEPLVEPNLKDNTTSPAKNPIPLAKAEISEENIVASIPQESNLQYRSNTDNTLKDLKQQWRDLDTQSEDLTYPFGGWTDVKNYKK